MKRQIEKKEEGTVHKGMCCLEEKEQQLASSKRGSVFVVIVVPLNDIKIRARVLTSKHNESLIGVSVKNNTKKGLTNQLFKRAINMGLLSILRKVRLWYRSI